MDFFGGQLEHEIRWESLDISLDGLVQHFRLDLVQFRQIRIQHDFLPANLVNQILDQNNLVAHISRTI